MFCDDSYTIYMIYVIGIVVIMCTPNKASVKWEIKTKPLVIGEEARLSCNANDCQPGNTKKWLGGKNYDLLCQDNQSKHPLKYKMTSNGTNFDLRIKEFNFTDVDCEYTCACGFQQFTSVLTVNPEELVYPPRLQRNSSTQNGGIFHIDILMEVYPYPNCNILFQENASLVNIPIQTIPEYDNDFKIFEVAIQKSIEPHGSFCKGSLTLHCEVGNNEYSLHLYRIDLCKVSGEETPKVVLYVIVCSVAGILFLVFSLLCIKCMHAKYRKNSYKTKYRKENDPDLTKTCMVQLTEEENYNTGATDEGTPCKR